MTPADEVQFYALVLVVDRATFRIKAASRNAERLGGTPAEALLGQTLSDLYDKRVVAGIREGLSDEFPIVVANEDPLGWPAGSYQAVVHTFAEELVVEVEPRRSWPHSGDYAARLNDFTHQLQNTATIDELLQTLCDGLVYHFGYDRGILLQFDQQYESLVTHEARNETNLPSLLNTHFAEGDVPARSRYNQLVETVHNYADVNEPLFGFVGEYGPGAREVVRRHIASRSPNDHFARFLKDNNLHCMGYLSLILDGKLWGSLYLHSIDPLFVDYQMRSFLKIVGRVTQQKIAYHYYSRSLRLRQVANAVRDRLQDNIVKADSLAAGLSAGTTTLIDLIGDTHGAAICADERLTLCGSTPTEDQIDGIVRWMKEAHGDEQLYTTDNLAGLHPPAGPLTDLAAGILFLPLDVEANQWIIWFKPEVVQTITWGSETDTRSNDSDRRFYIHKSTRLGHSLPWTVTQTGTALALQVFIQDVVMKRYANAKKRNTLLREAYEDLETFSYTVGHDLRAPLRGISSYAEILEEDFTDALGEEGLGHLRVIQENAERMRVFMTDLLTLSRIDRTRMIVNELSVPDLVKRVLADRATGGASKFECRIVEPLPPIHGDHNHLITVFTNLLSNAIKYSSEKERPYIEVGHSGELIDGVPVFYVSDNGIGIPEDQFLRVFDLFARSGNASDYSGTGIGLSLVQRILRFHGGKVWIESELGVGTKFFFTTGTKSTAAGRLAKF